MSTTVCLYGGGPVYPEGGYIWVFLNWALGLRAQGCRVIWLEAIDGSIPLEKIRPSISTLKNFLEPYGLADSVAVCSSGEDSFPQDAERGCLNIEDATQADLFLNVGRYTVPASLVQRFRRSALVDIDPGLLQIWMTQADLYVARHDTYFTIGETVGCPGARFPDAGLKWVYTPPPVTLDLWQVKPVNGSAALTTVSHWWGDWMKDGDEWYSNEKRSGFLPFLELPRSTSCQLELAVDLTEEEEDWPTLTGHGWRIRSPNEIASTPWDYQNYIRSSLGEFSCVKPSCVRLQNAWISDRTICYLASGKPAIVQHTGASRFLPDAAGLFRFRDMGEAIHCIESVIADYERQCQLARSFAEEYFDGKKVVARVLARALT